MGTVRARRLSVARVLALTLGGLALLASSAAGEGSAAAAERPSRVQAFLLASAPDSLADLEAHAGSIGVVYPTYFSCAPRDGLVQGADDPAVSDWAAAHQVVVMPRFSCQEGPVVHRLLSSPRTRLSVLTRLTAIARDPLYAGLSLDLENDGARDRGALSAFVAALARRLHRLGKKLSVVVDGVTGEDPAASTGFYDDRAIAAAADSVFVLAWGTHWEGSAPGPIAPRGYVEAVARYVASLPHAARFVLGVPMYGLDWAGSGGRAHPAKAYEYAEALALAQRVGATPRTEPASGELTFSYVAAGVTHRVWCMDASAVAGLLRIGREHGLGVGLWRLGEEDQSLWSSSAVAP